MTEPVGIVTHGDGPNIGVEGVGLTPDGCPCGTYGPCCDHPDTEGGHELFCACTDDYCDYHWHVRCTNCGAQCGCNV